MTNPTPLRRQRRPKGITARSTVDGAASGFSDSGAPIEQPAFQLQARSSTIEFDIFTETTDQAMWHFRRDDRISRPVSEVTTLSGSGLPIVRPEVQLLYMAKSAEAKSQHDFDIARPRLEHGAAFWLAEALATTLPRHPWTREL